MTDPARWTRQQVDDRISRWNDDLRIATHNILELMEDFSYKRLSADGGLGGVAVDGVTKERVTPAIESLDEMWGVLPLLAKVIDDANELYKKLPWFKDVEPLWKIQQLLQGASIEIKSKTTYAQRGLLTPDEVTQRLVPERVMEAMVEAYARAKAVVVEVGDVIARLDPQLDAAAKALAALAIDLPGSADIARLQKRLDEIQARVACDPLGLATVFETELAPAIAKARAGLEDAKRARARIAAELAGGDALIAELEAAYAEALAAEADRKDKIAIDHELAPLFGREVVDQLVTWLARLRGATGSAAVKIGLANWRTQLDTRIAACRAVAAENRAPLERRHELRGLLDALSAKAAATGLAEDPHASELFTKARASLYTRPTRLANAERLVADYLAAVR